MPRTLTPELMDDPAVPREDLARSLRYIRLVNARFGGAAALVRHLRRWSRRWPRDRAVTLLDIATGSADIPIAARGWALRAGFDLRITAIDLHETTLALAHEHLATQPEDIRNGVTLARANALQLIEPTNNDKTSASSSPSVAPSLHRFVASSYDYTHSAMFLHHLPDIEVLTVLRIMDRLARGGIVWNDLVRSPLAHLGVRILTLNASPIVKHDARVSVAAGFTRAEVRDIAQRVGLPYCAYRSSVFTQRFTLAGEKPGAWEM